MSAIDWSDTNTHWGEVGHNLHESSTGSWVTSAHGEDQ